VGLAAQIRGGREDPNERNGVWWWRSIRRNKQTKAIDPVQARTVRFSRDEVGLVRGGVDGSQKTA